MQQKFCSSHYPFAFHNKNLAKKLSDFDEILTSKSIQMVFWVVEFLSKSNNFWAKFLYFLKGPSVEYLISLFFELTHMYVKQKPRCLSGALTLELGPTVGGTVIKYCLTFNTWAWLDKIRSSTYLFQYVESCWQNSNSSNSF